MTNDNGDTGVGKLEDQLDEHERHIAELRERSLNHQALIEQNQHHIRRLDDAMTELRERFGSVATHADILSLHIKLDTDINGILKDAMASVPQKIMIWFAAIMAILTLADLISHTLIR